MNKLQERLTEHGSTLSPDEFRGILIDTMFRHYGGWSLDELLCRPDESISYCGEVRKQVAASLPEELILKTLLNIRKRKQFNLPSLKDPRRVPATPGPLSEPDAFFPLKEPASA